MKFKIFKSVKVVFIVSFLVFTSLLKTEGKAIPFIGNIYGSVGGSFSEEYFSGYNKSFNIKNNYNTSISLSAGASSNIPLPIIKSLRFELNYLQSLNNARSKMLGASVYYDVKSLPIVVPYVGVSLFYSNPNLKIESDNFEIKKRVNQGLTSLNIGAYLNLPLFPLSVFAEYKCALPGIFKNNINYDNKSYNVGIFSVGVRFYFL